MSDQSEAEKLLVRIRLALGGRDDFVSAVISSVTPLVIAVEFHSVDAAEAYVLEQQLVGGKAHIDPGNGTVVLLPR